MIRLTTHLLLKLGITNRVGGSMLTEKNPDDIHAQNVQFREAQDKFFAHVQNVIFEEHEIRTLQGLLSDYINIVGNYGFDTSTIKSAYIKDILEREFSACIGFYSRHQDGSYIDAAMTSIGISDEQLVRNVANRLRQHIDITPVVPWPSLVAELEKEEKLSDLLLYFLTCLKDPTGKKQQLNSTTRSLASLLKKYVTGNWTTFSINLSVTLHGLTKNKVLVNLLKNNGIGISYKDVLLLRDFWSKNDLKLSPSSPFQIANEVPAVVIVDNDDFKIDSLTGNAACAHRTNVMYVHTESNENTLEKVSERPNDSSTLSKALKTISNEMKNLSPLREIPVVDRPNIEIKRKCSVVHTLIRIDVDGSQPYPSNQKVAMFNGFQSCISPVIEKSKPYFHMTYPVPPNESVCYNVMTKLIQAMNDKDIPFAILVGDFPTFLYFLS